MIYVIGERFSRAILYLGMFSEVVCNQFTEDAYLPQVLMKSETGRLDRFPPISPFLISCFLILFCSSSDSCIVISDDGIRYVQPVRELN